ncbi:hypothetical protein L5G28_07660 [Gordonia sp. HY285]|uniref:hypothetical protein n=1 Tax=Gordonia liuliyuniae TaxID=2911517 RepID=UPI001F45631C|nr:hypothetical protein [Gordonia liuliyuniae]MCF8610037.1 hypothetical protein [Gordonia liuliyuniae]
MTGFNQANYTTAAVVLNLSSAERVYADVRSVCRSARSAESAAPMLRAYVETLQGMPILLHRYELTEIQAADVKRVDWVAVAEDMFGEQMRDEGRWEDEQ